MQAGEKIIEIKNLVKYYGKICALSDISFDVFQGDVFGFLGPNGAGKSTTIRAMLSLISSTSGQIKIFNKDLHLHRNSILSEIGCIVEKPDFYKYLSAQKNLEILARLSNKKVSQSKIQEIIEFVGLKGREKDKVLSYSHGMRQRLGIAQTLIHDPQLIILDEPTTGLDPQGIIDIRNLILQLKNERNKTIVLSSHILSEIELIANRMVIINKGKVIVQGEVKELLDESKLIVTFSVDRSVEAIQLLNKHFPSTLEHSSNDQVNVSVSKDMISEINKMFCDNNIQVSGIEAKRKLEDYFLKLINN